MEAHLAADPEKDAKMTQAIQAYLEVMSPKTLTELLTLSKDKPSEAAIWISILPPDTKQRFVQEIQAAIDTLEPSAGDPEGPVTNLKADFDRLKAVLRDTRKPNVYITRALEHFLNTHKDNPKINTKIPRSTVTYYQELEDLIDYVKAKIEPKKYTQFQEILHDMSLLTEGEFYFDFHKEILKGLPAK